MVLRSPTYYADFFFCIEQFALTEASYTTVRLMQEFESIESRDSEPWTEQRSQQLVTLLSLTVAHPLGNRGFLPTGKTNFLGPRVEVAKRLPNQAGGVWGDFYSSFLSAATSRISSKQNWSSETPFYRQLDR